MMSRIGKKPIKILDQVLVTTHDREVKVVGPKGELIIALPEGIAVVVESGEILVSKMTENRSTRALHGTIRAVLANGVLGVTTGFEKRLALEGLGYRARLEGKNLVLEVGFSHPVKVVPPAGINFSLDSKGGIIVQGPDRGLVGRIAAEIRQSRPPEPYKGTGVRYQGEVVRHKAGKAAKAGEGFGAG